MGFMHKKRVTGLPSVIDQNMQGAKGIQHIVHDLFGLDKIFGIGLHGKGLTTHGFNLAFERLGFIY